MRCSLAARVPSSCVVAVDERQAGIVFNIARRMVELDDDLVVAVPGVQREAGHPGAGRSVPLPARRAEALEGLDYTLAILDEVGRGEPRHLRGVDAGSGQEGTSTLSRDRHAGPGPRTTACSPICVRMRWSIPTILRWCGASIRRRWIRGSPGGLRALLGAGQPGAGRLPAPRRHARAAATQDARGDVSAGAAVPARPRHGWRGSYPPACGRV